jgi:hypothetical protein
VGTSFIVLIVSNTVMKRSAGALSGKITPLPKSIEEKMEVA